MRWLLAAVVCIASGHGLQMQALSSLPRVQPRARVQLAASALTASALMVSIRLPLRHAQRSRKLFAQQLPPGWVSAVDPSSGQTYYYNEESGQSQWESPEAEVPLPSTEDVYGPGGELIGGPDYKPQEKGFMNPYTTSSADRMREKFGEESVNTGSRGIVEDQLAADLAKFKAEKGVAGQALSGPSKKYDVAESEKTFVQKLIEVLGTVLTYNFAIIIAFFTWFIVGAGAQLGAQQTAIIDSFRGCWDWLIMPLLTTHMTLTFLSAGLERLPVANDGES